MDQRLFDDSFLKDGLELDEKHIQKIETVYSKINEVCSVLRDKMMQKWDRCLPLNELFGDRWKKARYLGFGDESSIYDSSLVIGDVKVGKNTWIGPFTILDGSGGLSIGDYCSISAGVYIYTHDTVKWALSGGKAEYERSPVRIGNCCHIGSQAIIAKGVTIGDHCVIGACSFANRDIPPYTIAAGAPCKSIGTVQADDDGRVQLKIEIDS